MTPTPGTRAAQRGGTLIGVIIGLLAGLGIALGVALYIAKVPVPFVDKVGHRSSEQSAAEAEKLKNWDPNAGLAGKPAPRPAPPASEPAPATTPPATAPTPAASAPAPAKAASRPAATTAPAAAASAPAAAGPAPTAAPVPPPKSTRDPAAILAGQDPRGAEAKAPPAAEGFVYFVQAGAYSNGNDAEQQRAKLAMLGVTAKVTEREQSGRTVYRVRLGPFEQRSDAEHQQEQLKAAGTEAALIRVERSKL